MKRLITALGICVLLAGAGAAFAEGYTWGGATSDSWGTGTNWPGVGGLPDNCDPDGDSALIDKSIDGTPAPYLNADYSIQTLTMADGTSGSPVQLDTNGFQLTVCGTFTVGFGSAENTESYVEKDTGTGSINVEGSIVIQGGLTDEPTTLVVSAGSIVTT